MNAAGLIQWIVMYSAHITVEGQRLMDRVRKQVFIVHHVSYTANQLLGRYDVQT